jgi:hypothetical protein
MRRFPTPNDYLITMQFPQKSLLVPELREFSVVKDPLGMPKTMSGGCVVTFHLVNGTSELALRLFCKELTDLQVRYRVTGQFVARDDLGGILVPATYVDRGIMVNAQVCPLITMPWVNGDPLNLYVEKYVFNAERMKKVVQRFRSLVWKLERAGIAHGDLQHGNIIVYKGWLILIDYDSMYLPELSHLKGNLIGHSNYQHPGMTRERYDSKLDRFPAIVIYTALESVVHKPELWVKYSNGENMLFTDEDSKNPEGSALLAELDGLPEIRHLAERFRSVCKMGIENVPRLGDFISGNFSYPKIAAGRPRVVVPRKVLQYDRVDAFNMSELKTNSCRRVEVIGYVANVYRGTDKNGRRYVFLYLKSTERKGLALTIWPPTLMLFVGQGIDPEDYRKKWVSVIGVITTLNGRSQLEITMPSEIQVLADKSQAMARLGRTQPTRTRVSSHKVLATRRTFAAGSTGHTAALASRSSASTQRAPKTVVRSSKVPGGRSAAASSMKPVYVARKQPIRSVALKRGQQVTGQTRRTTVVRRQVPNMQGVLTVKLTAVVQRLVSKLAQW